MENLKRQILIKMEGLINQSCLNQTASNNYESLHVTILKKYYNASDVLIDYSRGRVEMNIVMDDKDYDPKTVNVYMPTLHMNLWFRNLRDLLKSCIDSDNSSLAFYARLLSSYHKKSLPLMIA